MLTVVAVHTRFFHFPAGFIAVDLFFVLSGFLITCLLLEEWERCGGLRVRRFYLRRALRLLPALAVMLFTFVVYHWLTSSRPTALAVTLDALVAFFYSSNWTLAHDFHQPNLFGHCWSLSIEEQFYLLWPVLLLLLLRRSLCRKTALNWLLLAVAVVVFERMLLVATGSSFYRFFYGTDTRADRLLLGCAGALAFNSGMLSNWLEGAAWKLRVFRALGYVAIGGLLFLGVFNDFNWELDVTVAYALIPIFGIALLLNLVIAGDWAPARILKRRELVYIGKISYGVYLWHYPIFTEVQNQHWTIGKEVAVEFALTSVAVLGSYYLLEQPLLRVKARFAGTTRARSTPLTETGVTHSRP